METLFWFENVKGRDDLNFRHKPEDNTKTGLQEIVCVCVCVCVCDSGWDQLVDSCEYGNKLQIPQRAGNS